MGFFARPNIDNIQFKQLTGTTLTLSGTTQIATSGGLELIDVATSTYIPIKISGASEQDVLKYVGGELILGQPTSGGTSTGVYDGLSPSTICVGGMPVGTTLTGETITCLLQDILVPTLSPTLTAQYNTMTLSPITTIFEVGCQIVFGVTGAYNAGVVNPVYCGGPSTRTGLPNTYNYIDFNGSICNTGCTSCSSSLSFASRTVSFGTNSASLNVSYDCGESPLCSNGSSWVACKLPAGNATTTTKYITGLYPWFWGTSATAPDVSTSGCTQCLITGYTCKCCASSSSNIIVDDFVASSEYLWFAIPSGSTKTAWQGANNVSNNGIIPGGLFPAPTIFGIESPESCWGTVTPVSYEIYVSSYATDISYAMTFS